MVDNLGGEELQTSQEEAHPILAVEEVVEKTCRPVDLSVEWLLSTSRSAAHRGGCNSIPRNKSVRLLRGGDWTKHFLTQI